jgi:hypothetical protein
VTWLRTDLSGSRSSTFKNQARVRVLGYSLRSVEPRDRVGDSVRVVPAPMRSGRVLVLASTAQVRCRKARVASEDAVNSAPAASSTTKPSTMSDVRPSGSSQLPTSPS